MTPVKNSYPVISYLNILPEPLGKVEALLADTGYYSKDNVASCEQSKIEAFIPPGRTAHNQPLSERFAPPVSLPEDAKPIDEMRHKLKTDEGRAVYAK
jgi:hypothetical protein